MKQNIKKVLRVMYGSLLLCPYRLLRQQEGIRAGSGDNCLYDEDGSRELSEGV